jgi:aminotransferase in exopolysaccharide biosynthesis
MRIPLAVPHLFGNEKRYLDECVETNFVSSVGPFVQRFEEEFAKAVGAKHAVACVNGTAALHLAMRVLGIGSGDEVFVPTFTFIASVNPVAYEKAAPIFVDCEARTWNLDPELVVREIRRRAKLGLPLPKAIEVVHILGHPADIEPIIDVCEEFNIPVIEDAAESLGATYRSGRFAGKAVGSIGTIGCFSFNGNKIITAGGGGMLATNNEMLARRARHLSTQARQLGAEYWHDEIGYNYRLTNTAAALGLAQLEQLPEFLARKREIAARYDRMFASVRGISLPPRAPWADPSMWMYCVLVDANQFGRDRNELMGDLQRAGVESRPLWAPIHRMPMYSHCALLGERVAENIFEQGLALPCSVGLTKTDQDTVIDSLLSRAAKVFHEAS